jgi:SAM-dependent methyltransferase
MYRQSRKHKTKTSWEGDSKWYKESTTGAGNYFHEHVVIPGARKLLGLTEGSKLLDLGCGTGVLGRAIQKGVSYVGIDAAPSLIEQAEREDKSPLHTYLTADVTRPLGIDSDFTHAAIILALQNMKDPFLVLQNVATHIADNGVLVIILNHPCFRIPRQSSWGIDETNKLQYRRINRYLSTLEIPITMHPGKQNSTVTWSYHHPLGDYTAMLKTNGFVIDTLEEWASDKHSTGSQAKMENRTRKEIPLFMAIRAIKYQPVQVRPVTAGKQSKNPLTPPPRI